MARLEEIDHRKLLNDDRRSLDRFVEGLEALTMRIAHGRYDFRQDEAEDVLLEVLKKLWESDKAALRAWRGEGSLEAYLATIVNRYCLMELRRRKRRPTEQSTDQLDTFEAHPRANPLEREQLQRLYLQAAADLVPRDRQLLQMRFVEERDYTAIMSELDISYAAARKAVHTALNRVREKMREIAPELFPDGIAS